MQQRIGGGSLFSRSRPARRGMAVVMLVACIDAVLVSPSRPAAVNVADLDGRTAPTGPPTPHTTELHRNCVLAQADGVAVLHPTLSDVPVRLVTVMRRVASAL